MLKFLRHENNDTNAVKEQSDKYRGQSDITMAQEYIIFNLREALSSLTETIKEIEIDSQYDEAELYVAMQHIYHHLNHAWNARHA